MLQKILAYLQYILPQHLVSSVAGWIGNCRIKWIKNWQIKRFIRANKIDMSRVLVEDINQYPTFEAFFIRHLKPQAMGTALAHEIASPAEATICQYGVIDQQTMLQAKNKYFNLQALLANDKELTQIFMNGSYMIFFLAPHNYHRYHMPYAGKLSKTIFVPGKLFGVDFYCQKLVDKLYNRNERYITVFDTDIGKMGVVLIGALLVGSIQTAWLKQPIQNEPNSSEHYDNVYLRKADELGFFKAGSTIILLFEPGKVTWKDNLAKQEVKVAQAIADINHSVE